MKYTARPYSGAEDQSTSGSRADCSDCRSCPTRFNTARAVCKVDVAAASGPREAECELSSRSSKANDGGGGGGLLLVDSFVVVIYRLSVCGGGSAAPRH